MKKLRVVACALLLLAGSGFFTLYGQDFKKQVIYPATLEVGLRVERTGERSFKMVYGIFFHGTDELAATAASINAWANYTEGRAVELPEEIRAALAEYQ